MIEGPRKIEEPASPAFAALLRPTRFDARNVRLYELSNDPAKLVRENRMQEGHTLDALEQSIRDAKAHFEAMSSTYGIHVVSIAIKREKNNTGDDAVFTVVDKIEGQNLSDIVHVPAEAMEELEALYIALGTYYYDAWKHGLQYWGDGRSDQFVYGAKYGEQEKHFYLTDVDPEFYRDGDDQWHTLEAAVGSVCHDLLESERKGTPKIRFHKARAVLLDIVTNMLQENPHWSMLVEARGWLEQ